VAVDQKILDGVGAAGAAYTDITRHTSSLSGYSIIGTPYNDEENDGPSKGLQMVIYGSTDHSQVIITFVGTNEGNDAIGDLGLGWDQFSESQATIQSEIASALTGVYSSAAVTFAGHSAGGIIAQYAAYDYQKDLLDNEDSATVNLVTNNAPGVTDMLIAEKGEDYDPLVGSAFAYVANTFERDDVVHMMGSEYLGGSAFEIQPSGIYDLINAHLVSNSLHDLNRIDASDPGYNLASVLLTAFGISDVATIATSQALAEFSDVIGAFNDSEAYAYAFGQFLFLAGALANAGQTDGVKQLLDTLIARENAYMAAQPGGDDFMHDVGAPALVKAFSLLEGIADLSPTFLMLAGTTIKDAAVGGDFTLSTPEELFMAVTASMTDALDGLLAGGNPFANHSPIPLPVEGCLVPWLEAPAKGSPLVIDLSTGHSGVTLTEFDAPTTTTFFDIDGTGFASQTAWTSGDTGFLVRDLNSNGKIDDVSEMFGSPSVDGFAKLAALDSNHDLKIDANDSDWSALKVWIDDNGDAITDNGELHTLASLDIVSIDLAAVEASTDTIDGNQISHTSMVTFVGGATAAIDDAWFTHSVVNTYYNGDFALDPETLFLPDLRGYGTVAQLSIAMSQDSTLKGLVEDFATDFSLAVFSDPASLDTAVSEIIYQWAGVQEVDSSSRGPNVDAQHLEALEHMFGNNFVRSNGSPDPDVVSGETVEQAWQLFLKYTEVSLTVQAGATTLFENPVSYNPWSGALEGDLSLSQTGITDLAGVAPGSESPAEAFWVNIAQFLNSAKGLDNLTGGELGWLDDAVTGTTSIGWDDIVALANLEHPGSSISGTSGNDTLTGTQNDDTITGNGGADTINAGAGNDSITLGSTGNSTVHGDAGDDTVNASTANDTIYGDAGNDTINSGGGNDTVSGGTGGNLLNGGGGDDTYIFGGGDDVITDGSGTDQITMGVGIVAGDLTFTRVATGDGTFNDLLITVADGGSLQIVDQFLSGNSYRVETVVFSDTSTLDLTALTTTDYPIILSSGNDTINLSLNTAQVIYGLDGADVITTGSGTDTLDGGNGNDILSGGTGNDTYIASPGYDKISESGGTDVINVMTGYSASDVTFSRHIGVSGPDNDLVINIAGLGQIQIEGMYASSSDVVESLHFADGNTTISITDQVIGTVGSSGNDTLYGLTSSVGSNWFDGRGGNDTINNGIGDNTYFMQAGFGTVTINQPYHADTNIISFLGLDPSHIRMWTTSNGYLHLQDTTDTSHSITVQASTTGSGTDESTIGTYLEQIVFDDVGTTTWDLTGALTITGTSSGETLYGTAYADSIYSMGGDDTLYGNHGNDAFYIGASFGNVGIHEDLSSGTDTVHLTGIDPNDLTVWTDTSGNLLIQKTTDSSHTITIYGGISSGQSTVGSYVESIVFDNSVTWDLTAGLILTGTNTGSATITGTSGNDIITAGTGATTINAGDGNDILTGKGSADTLNGGNGNDTITGAGGGDNTSGGAGNDTYIYASGWGADNVTESLSAGTDTLHFTGLGPSDIRLYTDSAGTLHVINNNNGSDTISIGAGKTGNNTNESTIGSYVEQITFDDINHTTWSLTAGLTITGTSGGDTLYGTAYDDTILGMGGTDGIYGNAGNDIIVASGASTVRGGPGDDTYVFSSGFGNANVIETTSAGSDTINFAGIDPSHIRMWTDGFGSLFLQDSADTSHSIAVSAGKTGSNTNESTIGQYVEHITFDSSYNTTWDLTGGLTFTGTSSGESLYGTAYNDTLYGLAGVDALYGNAGDDVLFGGTGNDVLTGGPGTDTVDYSTSGGAVTVNLSTGSATGDGTDTLATLENVNGSAYGDTITGDGNANVLNGGAGNDSITGGAGNDTLLGGAGDDSLDGGSNTDTADFSTAASGVTVSLAAGTATGDGSDTLTNIENVTGSTHDDTIVSSSASNTLDGGAGSDTVSYASAASAVTVNLSTGSATGDGTDTLSHFENVTGSANNDTITGDSSVNILSGGSGNDTITGGGGADELYGNSGADTFLFKAASAFSGVVNIHDFTSGGGNDVIDIKDVISTYDPGTMAITDWVQITTVGSDSVVKVDTDGTGSGHTWQQIAVILGVTGLTDEAALVTSGNLVAH
jgi:Ca2+-binding RTX toxin-like protein